MRRVIAIFSRIPTWSGQLFAAGLIAAWLLVLAGVPAYLPIQLASWLTFTALLITPGYLLADLITWRRGLDELERLALALPLGMASIAVPGIVALLQHWNITQLTAGWMVTACLILAAWLLYTGIRIFTRASADSPARRRASHGQ